MTLSSYPEYKPSGVDWLGKVPAHWELVPNRGLMTLKKEVVGPRACRPCFAAYRTSIPGSTNIGGRSLCLRL